MAEATTLLQLQQLYAGKELSNISGFKCQVWKLLANMDRVMSTSSYPTELGWKSLLLRKRVAMAEAENWEPRGGVRRNASNLWNRAHLSALKKMLPKIDNNSNNNSRLSCCFVLFSFNFGLTFLRTFSVTFSSPRLRELSWRLLFCFMIWR